MKHNNINILISSLDSGGLGGNENYLYWLTKSLKKNGISVTIAVVNNSDYHLFLKKEKVKTLTTPVRMDIVGNYKGLIKFILFLIPSIFWNTNMLLNFIKNGGRLLLITGISDKILLTPIAKLLGIKVIWIEYGPLELVFSKNYNIPKYLYKMVKNLPNLIVVSADNTMHYISKEADIDKKRIQKLPLGIEMLSQSKIKEFRKTGELLKQDIGIDKEFVIGMISRVEKEKGQDTLIKSVARLKKYLNNYMVIIAGSGDLAYLDKLIRKYKLSSKVRLLGYVDDDYKWALMSIFDVFVFPTRWKLEGFGIVSLEAMMMGVPLIASDFGPVPEVVENAGLLIKPTSKDLYEALLKLIKSKKLRDGLIKKGYKRVKDYDIDITVRSWIKVFKDI